MFDGVSGANDLQKKLKDGVILCNLMNKVNPGSIKKFKKNAKMPFQQMENIGFFNAQLKAYGIPEDYIFVTNDLFENKNMGQVLIGLRHFADKANANGVLPKFELEMNTVMLED